MRHTAALPAALHLAAILALILSACVPAPTPAPTASVAPTGPATRAATAVPSAVPSVAPTSPATAAATAGATATTAVETVERLDPATIPQFVEPLVIPPVMPSEGRRDWDGTGEVATEYRIAARQFEQQVLPSGFPKTTVWGYGHAGDPLPGSGAASTFNFPAFTVEARSNERVRVVWMNELVDAPGSAEARFLPHLLPVDQTLAWANPPGPADFHGVDPSPYTGPVPIVTHVHGAHVPPDSDGFPAAWYLPAAANIPADYTLQGGYYGSVHPAPAGSAVFEYPNDQRATTLWYHDHALGITRLNVYAGLAGFWLLRDDVEDALDLPGPAPAAGDAPGTRYYEIPIAIQDRSFNADGSLFYPDSRAFFDEYAGPYAPETEIPPIWNPEFFGDTMVVNGRTWPYLEVEPRLYRLRLLNGTDSRFLLLRFDTDLAFNQIGNEGGLLPDQPIVLDELLLAPAERADVLVDFSAFAEGDSITLLNLGPDSPFGSLPLDPADVADPDTTGKVMQFKVVVATGEGNLGRIPETLPAGEPLTTTLPVRSLTLNEKIEPQLDIPVEAQLGATHEGPLDWENDITEKPIVGDVEIWQLTNLTADAHPIHLHLVHFQVLDRTPIDAEAFADAQAEFIAGGREGEPPDPFDFATGDPVAAAPAEGGLKDTVNVPPDMVTRVIARFDLEGLYVWHCHILEHEDNEMMRRYTVLPD